MFSLITTIISIALAVGVTGATMYYVGSATDGGGTTAAAAELLTQSEQIAAAIDMRGLQAKGELATVAALVTGNYLTEVPKPPKAAYAAAEPSATDWWVVKPAVRPVVVLQAKIKEEVCLTFNQKFQGTAVIRTTIDPTLRIQCFGAAAPYSVLINSASDAGLLQSSINGWNDAVTAGTAPAGAALLPQPEANGGSVASSGQVSLATATLPTWEVGQVVNYDFKALFSDSVDTGPNMSEVSWSSEGTLPDGLALDAATGVLSGTPTVKGNLDYTVKATYKNATGQQVYKIVVKGIELDAVQISAGGHHTCAVTREGGVKCWGMNYEGQLGDGTRNDSAVPVAVQGLDSGIKQVAAGGEFTCAVTDLGTVKCWGYNDDGELGSGSTSQRIINPVDVTGLNNVQSISVGFYHACALTTSGGLYCWGGNWSGELGIGSITPNHSASPLMVFSSGISSVSLGTMFSCAISIGGDLTCWGHNSDGELGVGDFNNRYAPTQVMAAKQVSVGSRHSCAIAFDNTAYCWGDNNNKALGLNVNTSLLYPTPTPVYGTADQVAYIATGYRHSCALMRDKSVQCWGANTKGQAGTGGIAPGVVNNLPVNIVSLSVGGYHNCVLTETGTVHCWGDNMYGTLGDGTTISRSEPGGAVK